MSRREIEPSVEAFKLLGLIADMGPITVGDLFELAKSEEIFSSSATMRTRLWGLEFAGAVQVEVPPHLEHYTSTYSDEYVVRTKRETSEETGEGEQVESYHHGGGIVLSNEDMEFVVRAIETWVMQKEPAEPVVQVVGDLRVMVNEAGVAVVNSGRDL